MPWPQDYAGYQTLNQFLTCLVLGHYNKVADNYDDYFEEIHDSQLESVVEKMKLQPHHCMVDVGSGTCRFAEKVHEFAGLENPIICVEPFAEMLAKAKGRKGVHPVLKGGEEFFNDASLCASFDRVLFIQSYHHLKNPSSVLQNIQRSLRPGGICSIWNLTSHSCFEMFTRVTTAKLYSSSRHDETYQILQQANFEVERFKVHLTYDLTKAKLYSMLRGRFITNLYELTDQEIEDGIEKLERDDFKSLQEGDVVKNEATYLVIQGTKLNRINNNSMNS